MIRPLLEHEVICTSTLNGNISKFSMYPNPSSDYLFLNTSVKNSIISIFSLNGNLIKSYSVSSGLNKIDISFYIPGMYFVEVINNAGREYKKLIIK